jgi:hypothetical protein
MFLLHEEKAFSVSAIYFVKRLPPEDLSDNEFVLRTLLEGLKTIHRTSLVNRSAIASFKVPGWLNLKHIEISR